MGKLYKTDSFGSLTATGEASPNPSRGGGNGTRGGDAGKSAFYDITGYIYTVAGGGGGGSGGNTAGYWTVPVAAVAAAAAVAAVPLVILTGQQNQVTT